MNWIGKLVGALLGYILTRRPMGVLLGMIIGHLYDQYAAAGRAGPRVDLATVRETFFRTAFSVMGHVAKSDGRVSEQDIAAARRMFRQFNLNEADTRGWGNGLKHAADRTSVQRHAKALSGRPSRHRGCRPSSP